MPHLNIEFSANLEGEVDVQTVVERIHHAAISTGIFPLGGIRTRAERRDHYLVADERPDAGYIHVMIRIGAGRSVDDRRNAGDRIFQALCEHTLSIYARRPLALSLELHEIPADMAWRKNNLHALIEQSA